MTADSRNARFFIIILMVTHPRHLVFARSKHLGVGVPVMVEIKISFFYQLLGNTPALPDNINVKTLYIFILVRKEPC